MSGPPVSSDPDVEKRKSYCRICQGFCAVEADIANGRIVRLRGDQSDPVSHGFLCSKGVDAVEQHHGPGRQLTSLKRTADGGHRPIGSETALEEIAAQLDAIVKRHGPQAVAVYGGTQSLFDAINPLAARAFAASLGAFYYGTMTIDQSAKWIAEARTGTFGGGPQAFADADVWMLVGSNPLVTLVAAGGPTQFGFHDPVRALKRAKARGLKLIVIDPRRSETARFADIFLQIRPGEDATLLAGFVHLILREGWHDAAFCAQYLEPLDELRRAVADFTPDKVAGLAGIEEADFVAAVRLFAKESRTGMVGSGTGPDMTADSNLAEHLVHAINLICGRFLKEGERISNPGVLTPRRPRRAEAVPPTREWETGPRSAHSGLGRMRGEMMSAALADEILSPAENRIRALICIGGNPAVALPDQTKAIGALRSLELLVTIDPRLSATAKLAHYNIAPLLPYERADQTSFLERFFTVPYAHYTEAIVAPDPAADLVDDWYVFWRLADLLGIPLSFAGFHFPTQQPDRETLLAMLGGGGDVAHSIVRGADGGRVYDVAPQTVEPGDNILRLDILPEDVADELATLARRTAGRSAHVERDADSFQLIVRRRRGLMNSTMNDASTVRAKTPNNPVCMHPDDMAALGLCEGEAVIVMTDVDRQFDAPVAADADLRPGVVAITHGWGPLATNPGPLEGIERATNLFVDPARGVQSVNAMPTMTGIPVRIRTARPSSH